MIRIVSSIDGICGRHGKYPITKTGEKVIQVMDIVRLADSQVYLPPFEIPGNCNISEK